MSTQEQTSKLRVVIAGGGVAGLEAALALGELAPGLTATTVLAPNSEFVDRPMTVREPFAYPQANRYALEPIVRDAGAELVADELAWVDPVKRVVHTRSDGELEYDVLVLALGARITPRYKHAITIDDRQLDETLHGLIQDVEEGYVKSVAFVAPGRMAWPLPLYELALMTSMRAFDMDVEVDITIVTPEDSPLAIFGSLASSAIGDRLTKAKIKTITSAYAEIPRTGEIVINPGDRYLKVDRVVALPELYGPSVRGVPLSEHGFLRVDSHCKLVDMEGIYAAGDATEFAIKHGGVSSQQADAAAESIAALAGAPLTPQQFHPVIRGMLLTGEKPLYLTARITGGQGFSSEITDEPTWSPPSKVASKYLAPYLAAQAPATR
jgi:sulfide:quinone oxidoreductase